MNLAICVATMQQKNPPGEIGGWIERASDFQIPLFGVYNTPEHNLGVVGSYHELYQKHPETDILCYLHDDLVCREDGWDVRVAKEFEDPKVAIVGFGGALAHGAKDLYKVPYRLNDLARFDYMSNVDDAEFHGERFTGSRDVAVLDGFALCVRRSFLDRIGGWEQIARGCDFFCYDYALSGLGRRHDYRTRLIGIRCHHFGGGTSVTEKVRQITSQLAYDKAHRWFYDEFRDVMPWRVPR
jgi:hypothetical protein